MNDYFTNDPILDNRAKNWSGRVVIIKNIVVDSLVVPDFFTAVVVSVLEDSVLKQPKKIEDSPTVKHRLVVFFRKYLRVILF